MRLHLHSFGSDLSDLEILLARVFAWLGAVICGPLAIFARDVPTFAACVYGLAFSIAAGVAFSPRNDADVQRHLQEDSQP